MRKIENYYFQLKTAIINGDSTKVRMFLAFLGEHSNQELKESLHPEWFASYQRIKINSAQNILIDIPPIDTIDAYDYQLGKEYTLLQRDLIKKILSTPKALLDILNINKLAFIEEEFPTDGEERVDLVVSDTDTVIYPIEIKVGRANHETIGQIRKYVNFFWRRLNYKKYYKVQGVVLAGSYDSITMKELKREANIVLSYHLLEDDLSFKLL